MFEAVRYNRHEGFGVNFRGGVRLRYARLPRLEVPIRQLWQLALSVAWTGIASRNKGVFVSKR
jgi:hypothetical protein